MKENVGKLTYPMLLYIWQESICIECTKYFNLKWAKLLKNHHIETSCKYALLHFCLYQQQNSEIKTDKICTELHIVA